MAHYRLSTAASQDIEDILAYTEIQFGPLAVERYLALLLAALTDVACQPARPGSILRPEIGADVRSYHLRHSRARLRRRSGGVVGTPRHFLIYRSLDPETVGIGRILHDAMEISRHVPSDYG